MTARFWVCVSSALKWVVETYAVRRVALMDQCRPCGRPQPALAADVHVRVCSHRGSGPDGKPLALVPMDVGSEAARRISYVEQEAVLVHATEALDMLEISKEALDTARRAGPRAPAAHIERGRDREDVLGQVESWSKIANRPSIEALYSVLWQARRPVARLFPSAVRGTLVG